MKESLRQNVYHYRAKLRAFSNTPHGKRLLRAGRYLMQILITGVIVYQLSVIGWNAFFRSLPSHPLYYLLFLAIYFMLPLSEVFAYKICWGIPYFKSIPIFIQKRIFNKDVMGYSGELVLMQWAAKSLSVSGKQIFKDIRDMNIISSAASTFVALGMLLILITTDNIRAFDYIFSWSSGDYIIMAGVGVAIIWAGLRFRKYLFSMAFNIAGPVFLLHAIRMVLIYCAQILQWYIVLPDIGLDIWFTFLSVNIIISRIPFIPNAELVSTGANIGLAKVLDAPVAAVAGLFLVHNVLDKILNLLFYLFFTYAKKTDGKTYVVTETDRP